MFGLPITDTLSGLMYSIGSVSIKIGLVTVLLKAKRKLFLSPNAFFTEIDGKKISSKTDIQTNLYSHSIGDTIKVTFYRGKDKKTVDLKLTKSTEDISD